MSQSTQDAVGEDDERSPFAEWLRSTREGKKLTQLQLAALAGMSSQQISNLETGRTRNPQAPTRSKLEGALGSGPPKEILEAEASLNSVIGLGELVGFDPYDSDALPNAKGVYVFYDKTKRPVYVGRATRRSIAQRVQEHTEKFWFKAPVVQAASYLAIADENLCKQVEQVIIKFMRTHLLLNRQGVETDPDDDGSDSNASAA